MSARLHDVHPAPGSSGIDGLHFELVGAGGPAGPERFASRSARPGDAPRGSRELHLHDPNVNGPRIDRPH